MDNDWYSSLKVTSVSVIAQKRRKTQLQEEKHMDGILIAPSFLDNPQQLLP